MLVENIIRLLKYLYTNRMYKINCHDNENNIIFLLKVNCLIKTPTYE